MAAFLLAALGIPAVWFVPPVVTFDGPSHFRRAQQVSEGRMTSERFSERAAGGDLPAGSCEFVDRLWNSYWGKRDFMNRREWARISDETASLTGTRRVEFTNTAVYSPVNYIFQALGIRLAGLAAHSPLFETRMASGFNLAGYLLLVVLAIELTPHFQRGFLLIATSPLMVVQAASVSADAINFALPLLFVAWTWRLVAAVGPPLRRDLAGVLLLALPIALLKPTAVAVLFCLLSVPTGQFGSPLRRMGCLAATFLCAGALWLAWNRPNMQLDVARWFRPDHPAMAVQRQLFLEDPFRYVRALGHFLHDEFVPQWAHFYAEVGGWVSEGAAAGAMLLFPVFLAGFIGGSRWEGPTNLSWIAATTVAAAASIFMIGLTLWLSFGSAEVVTVPGFGGRYLAVAGLLAGIAWSECLHRGLPRARSFFFAAGLFANAAGLGVILAPVLLRTF
jgi:uncharacterized membrane protein